MIIDTAYSARWPYDFDKRNSLNLVRLCYGSSTQRPHNAICDEIMVSYVEHKRDKRQKHNKSD